jgi:hypothetical protein
MKKEYNMWEYYIGMKGYEMMLDNNHIKIYNTNTNNKIEYIPITYNMEADEYKIYILHSEYSRERHIKFTFIDKNCS